MKDSEFIALLNVYLDHEISAADAARLEAEVQNNPGRRRIYQDYCRMQKACKALAHEFQHEPVPAIEARIIDFNAARRPARIGYQYVTGAFAAAAACVAIILVGQQREQAGVPQPAPAIAATVPPAAVRLPAAIAPNASSARAIAQTVSIAPQAEPPQPSPLGTDQLFLSGNAQADAMLRAAAEQADAQFAWMRQLQLAPIQQRRPNQQLHYGAQPTLLRTEPRSYNNRQQPVEADVEMTAFRFQR